MAKIVRCRKVGVDCDFEARGASDQQVPDKAAEHGRTTHGIEVPRPELVEVARKPSLSAQTANPEPDGQPCE